MTEYTITIDGYESGLTKYTVRRRVENLIQDPDAEVTVTEK